ncbi:beta strand repeat-containing protein [Bdellovibrio sp. HCB209]|uniref:beta strand repeat-containing protein n=1 Tax=Bdellovibrio sp. HCB209 TaxID=3394354 RepID=UPI0039B56D7D
MKRTTYSRFSKMRIVILFTSLFTSIVSFATPSTFSYQGRITSSTGGNPGFTMASFSFSIMIDKAGGNNPNCTLYREQKDLVPISADGLFDVAIGEGTADFPNSSAKVHQFMNNSATISCAEGGTFLVSANDRRFLDVQFNPNGTGGWNHITPAAEIRSVPYATNALSAETLGGLVATDYVRKIDLGTCTTGQYLTYNGSVFSCGVPSGSGSMDASYSIKGLVQFLTDAATSGIVVTGGVARVNAGTGANQLVKLDATGKLPAVDGSALTNIVASSATSATTAGTATNFSGSLSGDVTGTQSATSVDKVKGMTVVTTGAANGKVLKYSGGSLVFDDDNTGSTVSDSSYTVKGVVQFDTNAATSGIDISSGVAKVNFGTGNNQIVKLDGTGKLPAIDGSQLTNLPSPTSATNFSGSLSGDVTGGQSTTVVGKIKGVEVDTTGIANGKILKYDSSGSGKWVIADDATGGSPVDASYAAKGVVQFNSNATTSGITVSSGVASVNFGTGVGQAVQVQTGGKLPALDGSDLTNIVASSLSGILPIASGGTGASTKTAAFDALSPLAAKGSIVTHNGTNNISLAVGTNGQVLTADSAVAAGVKWASPTATDLTTITGTGIVQRTGAGTYAALGTAAPLNVVGTDLSLSYGSGLTLNTGSLVVDTGTTAGKIVALDGTGKLPAIDGSQLTNLPAPTSATNFSGSLSGDVSGTQTTTSVDKIKGITVDTTGIATGKVLKYDSAGGGKWVLGDDNTGGAPGVASYSATGLVQFDTNAATSGVVVNGSGVAKLNFGTAVGNVVQVQTGGKLPALDGSDLTGIFQSPLSTAGDILTHDGTNNVRMARGTAGQILSSTASGLQWIAAPTSVTNFSGSLAGDVTGSQSTTVVGKIKGVEVDTTGIANGKILKYDSSGSGKWVIADDATGSAPGDATYAAKGVVQFNSNATTSGITVSSGVASVNFGTGVGQAVQVQTGGKLPALDGSDLTNIVATSLASTLGIAGGGTGGTTKTAGFDNLSPLTTAGDLLTHDGTNNVRIARGTAGQILSSTAGGLQWINAPSAGVTSISGTSPIAVSGTTTPVISINAATASALGAVSVGTGLNVTAGGEISVAAAPDLSSIVGTGIVQRTGTGTYTVLGTSSPLAVVGSNIVLNTVPIASGGTGETTAAAAFNALAPSTTKGDLIVHDGSTNKNVRLPAGTNGYILTADSAVTGGMKWAAAPSTGVTSVSGTSPVQVSNGTTTPVISVDLATASTAGIMQVGTGLSVASGVVSVNSTSSTGVLLNGGNSFTAAGSVGTNDPYGFSIETNGANRITVASAGNVTVNAPTSGEALVVTGSIRGKSYTVPSGTTVDWSNGNTQTITANCGTALTFQNMVDGGVYTLAITTTSFTNSCRFSQTSPDALSGTAGSGDFYFLPANATPSGTNAVYSFMRIGSKVYVNWSSGYAN